MASQQITRAVIKTMCAFPKCFLFINPNPWIYEKRLNKDISESQSTPKKTANGPSAMWRWSCGSAQFTSLNRQIAIDELRDCANSMVCEDKRVLTVGVFGSLPRGDALPSSDADILIISKNHEFSRWFDRIPEYMNFFPGVSIPVEPFPYLISEVRNMLKYPGFMRTIIREILPLAGDEKISLQLKTDHANE